MLRQLKKSLALPLLVAVLLAGSLEYSMYRSAQRSPAALGKTLVPESDLPLLGRSGFDIVFSKKDKDSYVYDIPFPFTKYIERLEHYSGQKLNESDSGGLIGTLFPMGRSLQRDAAVRGEPSPVNPDLYFKFPRIVLGIDGEPASGAGLKLNLKNKFFTGYNEKAEALEIISYNEMLGRFEFQIVNDYAPGKIPKVRYAPRTLCLSCHQNQSPIFARSPWKESNANPLIATELKRVLGGTHYHTLQIDADQSLTTRLDTATDRANLAAVYQKIRSEICKTSECRKNLVMGILQLRLNRNQLFAGDRNLDSTIKEMEREWQAAWPQGLSIYSADIPDRDPFRDVTESPDILTLENLQSNFSVKSGHLPKSKIPAEFEPLIPRPPSEAWLNSGADSLRGNRLMKGLSQEFTQSDVRLIDQWLSDSSKTVKFNLKSTCQNTAAGESVIIDCSASAENPFSFSAVIKKSENTATVGNFILNSQGETLALATVSGKVALKNNQVLLSLASKENTALRTSSGFVLSDIMIDLNNGAAELQLYDQSEALNLLATTMSEALRNNETSFSRFILMNAFISAFQKNMTVEDIDRTGLPKEVASEPQPDPVDGLHPGFNLIKNNCRECHRNNEGAPVNFLGTNDQNLQDSDLCRRIEVCAPRMLYRLKMRLCAADDMKNKKSPMPPEFFLSNHKIPRDVWMSEYNPKILSFLNGLVDENELARDIQKSGMTQSEAIELSRDIISDKCPVSSSIIYSRLPKCEFDELKAASRCR